MKHILMIASKETADGLAPQLTSEELLAEVPELEQLCRIDTVQLMNRDSTNINSRDWLQMAACVREHYDAYDGFVLTHGTDTMAYTAAALSYLVQNNAKPVVITGSQKSIFNQDTDARENLRDARTQGAHEELQRLFEHRLSRDGHPARPAGRVLHPGAGRRRAEVLQPARPRRVRAQAHSRHRRRHF